jgi:hypothetical protein
MKILTLVTTAIFLYISLKTSHSLLSIFVFYPAIIITLAVLYNREAENKDQ